MNTDTQTPCRTLRTSRSSDSPTQAGSTPPEAASKRLEFLDATRAFALALGVLFHASLSFVPVFIGWAVQDISTSSGVLAFMSVSHSFRMELFFLIAGFVARSSLKRHGAWRFLGARVLRLGVPFALGWFVLNPLLISGWLMGHASLRGRVDVWAALQGGFASLAALPEGLWTRSHLWFLYYLLMITVGAVLLRTLLQPLGAATDRILGKVDAFTTWLAGSRVSIPTLALPTMGVLWFMDLWGVDTPDKSLRPHLPVLLLYGGCYAVGWCFGRQPEWLGPMARISPGRCFVALVAVVGVLALGGMEREPSHPWFNLARVTCLGCYSVMLWSLVWLVLGVFQKLCVGSSAVVRYLADASYWIYLIHLPIVIWLQVAVADAPYHWSLKLPFVTAVSLGVGWLTYDAFVRSTWLGWLLNGKRQARTLGRLKHHCAPAGRGT